MRSIAHIAALATLSSCAESDRIHTALPEVSGAKSVVFGAGSPQRMRLFASSIPIAEPLHLPFEINDNDRILEAAFFDRGLTEIGVSAGVLEPATDHEPLPEPAQVFQTLLDGTWTEKASPSAALAQQKIVPRRNTCTQFVARTIDSGARTNLGMGFAVDRDTALLGSYSGELRLIREDGLTALPDIPEVGPRGGFVAPDGRIFLGGEAGTLWELTIDPFSVRKISTASTTVALRHLTGGFDENGELEIFALSFDGQFLRYFRDRWEMLHQFPFDAGVYLSGTLGRHGPGHVLASRRNSREIARYQNGSVTLARPADINGAVQAMGIVEGLGAVISDELGRMAYDGSGEWRALGNSRLSLELNAIEQFGQGFLAAGVFGFTVEYRIEEGFCEPTQLGSYNVDVIAPIGESLVLAGEKPALEATVTITVLKRAP